VLRDGAGRARLALSVAADGGARINFKDEKGQATRVVTPEGWASRPASSWRHG
jgi:hypothetical protein